MRTVKFELNEERAKKLEEIREIALSCCKERDKIEAEAEKKKLGCKNESAWVERFGTASRDRWNAIFEERNRAFNKSADYHVQRILDIRRGLQDELDKELLFDLAPMTEQMKTALQLVTIDGIPSPEALLMLVEKYEHHPALRTCLNTYAEKRAQAASVSKIEDTGAWRGCITIIDASGFKTVLDKVVTAATAACRGNEYNRLLLENDSVMIQLAEENGLIEH